MLAIPEEKPQAEGGKKWGLFKFPFRPSSNNQSSRNNSFTMSSGLQHNGVQVHQQSSNNNGFLFGEGSKSLSSSSSSSVSSVARSFLPTRRRLHLDPPTKLYFPYEPGKQVKSAVRIKNTSKSHVAFKFQTTAPKCCFMRPPGAILAPGESLIATVFKFVEHPENDEKPTAQKSGVKFKIMSLKVEGLMDYVPELFDEQKDQVAVEQILHVVFVDLEHPTPALEKLNGMLAEAEAVLGERKKPLEDNGPKIIGEGLVIDEWKHRRERYLARQQGEGPDST